MTGRTSGCTYGDASLIRCISRKAGVIGLLGLAFGSSCLADENAAAGRFRERVQPILEKYCYGCHGYGANEGGRTLDEFASDEALVSDTKLWSAVLKNVRTGIMPPAGEERPTAAEREQLFEWIKLDVFGIDPADPDPGRVTLRRLNRAEYHNTIRDLMGVEYDTLDAFPADDAGYGFDNIGDVLSVSPLLLEKYLTAAEQIVAKALSANADGVGKDVKKKKRFFPNGPAPDDPLKRDAYARQILSMFAPRAYRRPVDDATVDRLTKLAKETYTTEGQTFEAGIGRAMVAILSSPRFLFRVEEVVPSTDERYPIVDEYTLASRLSYFLWSSTPDDELLRLAIRGELRANLPTQVERMLNDPRSEALVENFAGQWLRSRDVEIIEIEPVDALGLHDELVSLQRELSKIRNEQRAQRKKDVKSGDEQVAKKAEDTEQSEAKSKGWQDRARVYTEFRRLREVRDMFTRDLRRAMRRETEAYFDYIVRNDRDVLELVDSNYTFLNERLAKHYEIDGVKGDEMRRVELPADSPRGGVLTQATLLTVTSNPTRTSPVKRGLYILENILGAPSPPPPPPNIPVLEAAGEAIKGHRPTVRELQEQHRRDPLCHACHARMDPLGLALENFNALGMWRETENDQPIDPSGTLLTGESFDGIRQLKTIIKEQHRLDFYRCLAEKFLTYALGRGLEYYDEHTLDQIVEQLDRDDGKFSSLLAGIIESAPFQKQRRVETVAKVAGTK